MLSYLLYRSSLILLSVYPLRFLTEYYCYWNNWVMFCLLLVVSEEIRDAQQGLVYV